MKMTRRGTKRPSKLGRREGVVRALSVLGLLALLVLGGCNSQSRAAAPLATNDAALEAEASLAIDAIAGEDKAALAKYLDPRGVILVRRILMQKDQVRFPNGLTTSTVFSLFPDQGHYWIEEEVSVQPKEISGQAFRQYIQWFSSLVHKTRARGQHVSEEYSVDTYDLQEVRGLGPAATGKVLADFYWYVYFRKVGGTWRIWRMETVSH